MCMDMDYDDGAPEETNEFVSVDADLYLKDLISVKKPRRIAFDDDKWNKQ